MKNFSIIIPIYNEELYLKRQVTRLLKKIEHLNLSCLYEVILVENGSTDDTSILAKKLARKYKQLKVVCIPDPSYGQAFKEGIRQAQYDYIFQFDLDFWDIRFLEKSLILLKKYDIVIGSKNLSASFDHRPLLRRITSKLIESVIRIRFNIPVSDTHGLKAAKKSLLIGQIDKVICSNHFFDSELILRCLTDGSSLKELAVSLKEVRESRFSFLVRTQEVFKEFLTLLTVNTGRPIFQPYISRAQKSVANYLMSLYA